MGLFHHTEEQTTTNGGYYVTSVTLMDAEGRRIGVKPSARQVLRSGDGDSSGAITTPVTIQLDPTVEPTIDLPDSVFGRLRNLNLGAGLLHLISAVVMTVIAADFTLPVTAFHLNGPPGTPVSEGELSVIADVQLGYLTAGFLYLSALFHAIIGLLAVSGYRSELRNGRNRFRWVEYSLSSTLMIVTIALLLGTTDLAALIGIASANVSMILFGWLMEVANPPNRARTWWSPFWFGCIAGIGPWLAFVAQIATGDESPPGFVWGILVSIFVFFNCFALNQWLQYRRVGRWSDYLFGERTYIILSFVAKSALAWQLYANVLIPD
ncbi:MAG: heliorhodopsin HeR [Actinomycetota bacterium]